MKVAIINLGHIVSGDYTDLVVPGNAILMDKGLLVAVGAVSASEVESADVVVDANGATAIPGLIDSQVHNTFGDYTPRQKTVGFLESYVHGGTTTAISASEVHVPGRPKDPQGVKALALAAQRSFADYRPGGMRVYAGSVILEPGLLPQDFLELKASGVWLAKAGFGAVKTPFDYVPMVHAARAAGMITTVHTGGASIPGSAAIQAEHLVAMNPHVSFHVNGGPVALPDSEYEPLVRDTKIAMQVCTAGNHRTMKLCAELCLKHDQFDRLLIATDTPTGSGVMPLGMVYAMAFLSSFTNEAPEMYIAAATGNNARVYGLNSGFLRTGCDADVVLVDAPLGCSQMTAMGALKNGDPFAIAAVFTDGIPRFVGKSRNTPAPRNPVTVIVNRVTMDFSQTGH